MSAFAWLQQWYLAQCNGVWEHAYGVSITTLDNPGWAVEVELTDTIYENLPEQEHSDEYEDQHWQQCSLSGCKFIASCGPEDLERTIEVFREWAAQLPRKSS